MEFEKAENYLKDNILDKPKEFFTIEKLRKSLELDRKLSISELLIFSTIEYGRFLNEQKYLFMNKPLIKKKYGIDIKCFIFLF